MTTAMTYEQAKMYMSALRDEIPLSEEEDEALTIILARAEEADGLRARVKRLERAEGLLVGLRQDCDMRVFQFGKGNLTARQRTDIDAFLARDTEKNDGQGR